MQKVFYILFITLISVQLSKNASLHVQRKYERFIGDQGLYGQVDDVEVLTQTNFEAAILGSNRAWLIEFYNSWCGFCQRFAPSWKQFSTDVKGWRDLVVVAAIDCANAQNYDLCRNYEVMSYPTIRYFHENFEESPKNFGFVMNRGVTAKDHRQDLVSKIISEQKEERGKQYPNVLPYSSSNIDDIFDKASPDTKYAVLIIDEPGSLLGPELAIDLHKTTAVITKYAQSNNTVLLSSLPSQTLPSAFVIGRDKNIESLKPTSEDRSGFMKAIEEYLKGKGVVLVVDEEVKMDSKELEGKKEANELLEKVEKLGDVVFQMDLESALRYSLKREVGGTKEITGEKLTALRLYLQVLTQYFPFGQNGKALLREISSYAESTDPIEGIKIGRMVKESEKEERQVFSTPQKWLGCQGSSPQYRGYPCSLWTMFHYLTVNVAGDSGEALGKLANPKIALEAMHGYIKNFFGCSDCSQHFQEMAARRDINSVDSYESAIIWLWNAHNEVNKRLSGDPTEDPKHPKVQFPSAQRCLKCHKPNDEWDLNEVAKYLKHTYSSVNIRYQGADTKVIYLGLEGYNSTTHEGLSEEALQIQIRPFGEGVTNGTVSGASTSIWAQTKDKANSMITLLFSVLTVLCASRVMG